MVKVYSKIKRVSPDFRTGNAISVLFPHKKVHEESVIEIHFQKKVLFAQGQSSVDN